MQIDRLVNLTPAPVTLITASGGLITIPRDAGGRVRVEYVDDSTRGAGHLAHGGNVILTHPALWDSAAAGGLGVDGLPEPTPNVAVLVTGHMAEIAALLGRELDDLYVPIERAKGHALAAELHAYAALCPARYATPAMTAIVEHVAHMGKPVVKRPGVRGCYMIAGYDARTVLEVLELFGEGAVLESYPRLTEADIGSIRRWGGLA